MTKRVTIRDIAEAMGISKTTVSLALLDKYGVNEDTKSKVMMTAIEMGYNFDSLKKYSRSLRILVILADKTFLANPFWTEIMRGIEVETSKKGYKIDILILDSLTSTEDLKERIISSKASGAILLGDGEDINSIDFSKTLPMPLILLDPKNYQESDLSQVGVDNFAGGEKVCEFLVNKGHKKLCFVGDVTYSRSFLLRCQGFESAVLTHKGENVECIKIHMKDTLDKSNFYAGEEIVKVMSGEDRPTAIFCANDVIALSVMKQLKERLSLECIKDYSIVGFDNIFESSQSVPRLTTMNVNRKTLGKLGANVLLKEIEDPSKVKSNTMIYSLLEDRDSVKDLNKI